MIRVVHTHICGSRLATIHRFGQATVSRIYAEFTRKKAIERKSLDCPVVLGIDEHSLHKKQRFATTFCDLKNHKVFDVAEGRSEAELEPFLRQLKGRDKVRVVCIDLSSSYRAIIRRWFPRAVITHNLQRDPPAILDFECACGFTVRTARQPKLARSRKGMGNAHPCQSTRVGPNTTVFP